MDGDELSGTKLLKARILRINTRIQHSFYSRKINWSLDNRLANAMPTGNILAYITSIGAIHAALASISSWDLPEMVTNSNQVSRHASVFGVNTVSVFYAAHSLMRDMVIIVRADITAKMSA